MSFFSLEYQYIYNLISDYYENPLLHKIKDEKNQSLFGVQLSSFLLNERYYIICTTSSPIENKTMYLKDIPWTSFQVRTLTDDKYSDLPKIKYRIKKDNKFGTPLQLISRNNNISSYKTNNNLPLTISLLHTKGIEYEYSNEGTIHSALETHQTILQLE